MNMTDLFIVVPIVALVAFTIVYNLRRRKKGGCGCGDGCRNCPGCRPTQDGKRDE